ncbi:hypothetical protein K469DRAFT_372249 [Zopfia rhizophila CBS 207.26]|uniref:DUF7587 domain-containing protein n=1 Tax=Zopfia rhizophila CBS 207.26 TaxID=1314779 RepID=A0A6A6EIG7_9PEZI|nr:hypothetical protein K469DRAFT_372249 [Zopfia rhizophila CBS 207.26]
MDRYRFPAEQRPRYLYRVQFESARTQYDNRTGFKAADTETFISDHQVSLFKASIENHLLWNDDPNKDSVYVSAFARESHARHWARKLSKRNLNRGKIYRIFKIDTSKAGLNMYSALDLVDQLDIDLDNLWKTKRSPRSLGRDTIEDEYFYLYNVPAEAVVLVSRVQDGILEEVPEIIDLGK